MAYNAYNSSGGAGVVKVMTGYDVANGSFNVGDGDHDVAVLRMNRDAAIPLPGREHNIRRADAQATAIPGCPARLTCL